MPSLSTRILVKPRQPYQEWTEWNFLVGFSLLIGLLLLVPITEIIWEGLYSCSTFSSCHCKSDFFDCSFVITYNSRRSFSPSFYLLSKFVKIQNHAYPVVQWNITFSILVNTTMKTLILCQSSWNCPSGFSDLQ